MSISRPIRFWPRVRTAAAGLDVRFDEGDAEALPYPDAAFDVVTSPYGAMFAPRPERVAAELLRVCRTNGIVSMGKWTKEGFVGAMLKTFARFSCRPTCRPTAVATNVSSASASAPGAIALLS